MEHAIRAQIHERMAGNPVYYEKLSTQLDRIIQDLRNQVIDAAEACRRQLALRLQVRSEADFAAKHGLSPISFAIYEMIESVESGEAATADVLQEKQAAYRTHFNEGLKSVALNVEEQLSKHLDIVDWQANDEVQRIMRRDIKHQLRPIGDFTEPQIDNLAVRIVELMGWRSGR